MRLAILWLIRFENKILEYSFVNTVNQKICYDIQIVSF